MKRFSLILLTLIMLLSLVVCGVIAADSDYQFAVVYGGVHPFFDKWEPGAKAAAKDLGIPEPWILSPQEWDQTEQNQILDGAIA